MNTLYIRKTVDKTWGRDTDFPALLKLLDENHMVITPDKVIRMPESYISDNDNGILQPGKEQKDSR